MSNGADTKNGIPGGPRRRGSKIVIRRPTRAGRTAREPYEQSWHLEDADAIAAEYPYTFYKPSRELISRVRPGEIVKLVFGIDTEDPEAPGAERMWVIVEELLPDGSFRGRLDNEPCYIADLKPGDLVHFEPCHIIHTQHHDEDDLVERYMKRCMVTKRILDDGQPVGYLYREEPAAENDSGWRFTASDESDEYMDDSKNVAYVSLGAVLNRDDSFRDLLEAPSGSAFIRNPQTGTFVALPPEAT